MIYLKEQKKIGNKKSELNIEFGFLCMYVIYLTIVYPIYQLILTLEPLQLVYQQPHHS